MINTENIKTLYHSVRSEKERDFVLQNGIKADFDKMVYLSKYPLNKNQFKFSFIVKIPNNKKLYDWREIWEEDLDKEYDAKNPYFVYEGDIPKQYIKLADDKKIKLSEIIKLVESKTGKKIVLKEFISRAGLKDIERFIDKLFSVLNIDIVFTNHFYDRLNDLRNGKDIDSVELINLFKKFFQRYKDKISLLPLEQEAIIKDIESKLNLPFTLVYDKRTREIDFIAKTIMRKDNFLGSNKKFIV